MIRAAVVTTPRYAVRRERNLRIPMSDGATLVTDIFLPDTPGRYPVVMEYPLPQERHEMAGVLRAPLLRRAGVRLDPGRCARHRRLGGDGLDEYCPQEQLDGVAAIAWFAEQPWSTGAVGMFGTSYGGSTPSR